jgi:multidrug resistance efflux pump
MGSTQNVVEKVFFTAMQYLIGQLKTHEQARDVPETLNYDALIASAKAEIARLQSQTDKLHDLLEQGVYDVDTFLERRDELRNRTKAAEATIAQAKRPPAADIILGKLETVIQDYWNGNPMERNAMIKDVISRAEYHKPKGSGWGAIPTIKIVSWSQSL